MVTNDEVFTTKEAMEYLKTTKVTLLKMIKEGKIKANKVGRGYRILKSEIDNYLIKGDKRKLQAQTNILWKEVKTNGNYL